jgi:hypothetical protein
MDLFVIRDTRDTPFAREVVRNVVKGSECLICDKHGQFRCGTCTRDKASFSRICLNEFGPKDILVIDHAGQLSTSVMASLTAKEKNVEEYKPSFTDYMNQGTILDAIFSGIQQSPANIIVITHVVESELEDGAKRLVPNVGTANFSRNSAKYFGHVVHLKVANSAHKVGSATTYASNIITGSRTDIKIEDMSTPSLVPFLNGSIKAKVTVEHGAPLPSITKQLETLKLPAAVNEEKITEKPAPEYKAEDPTLDAIIPPTKGEITANIEKQKEVAATPQKILSPMEKLRLMKNGGKY